jgi:hypothetical protein
MCSKDTRDVITSCCVGPSILLLSCSHVGLLSQAFGALTNYCS